ncbi:MAG: hypothetical protein HUJ88_12025 [Fusobacterium necrophorum]|nr:hypothetical protein [Fusobacterium necrophorum]
MKIGFRTPNLEKRLKARTTGALKRKAKSVINPLYGKKGIGIANNPKKALYNKVYNKTTVDVLKFSLSPKWTSLVKENVTTNDTERPKLDKKKIREYVHDERFTKFISEDRKKHQDFILNELIKKIMKFEITSDEEIEKYLIDKNETIQGEILLGNISLVIFVIICLWYYFR